MTASPPVAAPLDEKVARCLFRVEVRSKPGEADPVGQAVLREAQALVPGVASVHFARVYLIEAPLEEQAVQRIAQELLSDPVNQTALIGASQAPSHGAMIEVHYQPGVMDPVAQSTRDAIVEMLPHLDAQAVSVQTGFRYDLVFEASAPRPDADALRALAQRVLANPVIQDIHLEPFWPRQFPQGQRYELRLIHVPIRDLDDAGLQKLSREGHLFLSLDEMRAIRDYYRASDREPTDIELETLAQTWSEHCVHKTLKSTIRYRGPADDSAINFADRPGHEVHPDGTVTVHNLLKSTVAAATRKLMEQPPHRDWCVSVFVDNAGVVRFDDQDAVCIKVETHNHPSAIEPYGGAATGIGGCIRDVLGTGQAAKPIANTDVFCVAPPQTAHVPRGVIHPKRILQQVVAGVRDYGNRMGIPTVNGAVYFHPDYLGNPLVYAGCVGLLPLNRCTGQAQPGDRIIALGGATGRDGIHGATFSSAELTDSHASEFAHAVQIGNPITQKKMMDVILQARDAQDGPLFHAITDCGAGGFSSAIGEMGQHTGARVALEAAPLKYPGLSYTEIWISEAQERMVLAVPPDRVEDLRRLCEAEDVGFCDLGRFGHQDEHTGEPILELTYQGTRVGRLSMRFLHEGIPTPTREAAWSGGRELDGRGRTADGRRPEIGTRRTQSGADADSLEALLQALLRHPNIASKHWIIRQYDHEVQGGSAVKPLVGPQQDGPSDGAVLRPKLTSRRGVALACGLAPHLSEKAVAAGLALEGDSYWATLAAIDEAVRNVICVGADPDRIALLDNFCWPRCDDPYQLGSLLRAAEACYDGALAYRTPFISGKDSLSNQFTTEDGKVITIPPTLLITALGIVPDVSRCCTMDAKAAGHALLIVGQTTSALGGSHYRMLDAGRDDGSRDGRIPRVDLARGPATTRAVAGLIQRGLVASAHDCSDGGLFVAAAEMAFAGRVGLDLDLAALPTDRELDLITACFAETPSRYLLEVEPAALDAVTRALRDANIPFGQIGTFADHDRLTLRTLRDGQVLSARLDELRQAWLEPLDW